MRSPVIRTAPSRGGYVPRISPSFGGAMSAHDMTRREWLLGVLALAAACRVRDAERHRDRTVVLAYDRRELQPDADLLAPHLLFLPLVRTDARGTLRGYLAERWDHSADHREWTFHLRDVTWHDGVPVTAEDIAFTLAVLTHPDVLEEAPDTWESVRVIDRRTIRIRAGHYGHQLLQGSTYGIRFYPRHILGRIPPAEFFHSEFWTRPVGNGAYRFVRYVPDTLIELERNPDYFRGPPRIERVLLKFSRDAGLTQLLSGEADAITLSGAHQLRRIAEDPRFRVYHWYRGERPRAIYWNGAHPLFRDARVRRALTLALDRRELLRAIGLSPSVPVVDGFYTERQLLRGDLPEPLPHDPARAEELFREAGWGERASDGIREREGVRFRFTALVDANYSEDNLGIGLLAQAQLKRIGVQMDLHPVERLWPARVRTGAFEAAIYQIWRDQFRADGGSPYADPASPMALLLERLNDTADPDAVDDLHREMTAILQRDVPATFLFPYVYHVVAHRRIRGLESPHRADPAGHMEDLWLEGDG